MAIAQINTIANRLANGNPAPFFGREWKTACPEVRELVAKVIDEGGWDAFTFGDYLKLVGGKF